MCISTEGAIDSDMNVFPPEGVTVVISNDTVTVTSQTVDIETADEGLSNDEGDERTGVNGDEEDEQGGGEDGGERSSRSRRSQKQNLATEGDE